MPAYSTPYPERCPFGVGDVVKFALAATSGATLPLTLGRIYTVRATRDVASLEEAQEGRAPLVWVHGHAEPFLAVRFELVAKAPANDPPCEAVTLPRQMAQVFRECVATHGFCDVHDLARAGFTAAQITEYQDEARGLAGPLASDGGEAA
ncbi:hypothetical protein [Xanthobacter autotrophicus]|uniref:hypothetical protein n=1 Tax=Xanthobacter autotrophicus TaxID=280 RepID=UPI003729839D